MFELEINDTVYQFNFGVGFLREINKLSKITKDGISKDIGLQLKVGGLVEGDVLDLVDVLDVANKGQSPRLSKKLLEAFIDDPDTDIDQIFEDVLDFLKKSNATKTVTERAIQISESQKKMSY